MNKFIQYLDFYPTPINFSFKGRKGYSTCFGVFLTFATIILFILSFVIMGSDMIYKTNPTVLSQKLQLDNRPWQYIGMENFTLSFVFANETDIIKVPEDYFYFEAGYIKQSPENAEFVPIPLKTCNVSNYNGFEDQFNLPNPQYYLTTCFDVPSIELGGFWTETYMSSIYFIVHVCKNSTTRTCAPLEKIEKLVNDQLYLLVLYTGKTIDISNYEKPIKNTFSQFLWTVDLYTFKHYDINLKKVVIDTDDGFLLEDKKREEDIILDLGELDLATNNKLQNTKVFYLNIFSSDKLEYINRRYKKIQDLTAQIGGILNILFFVCQLLAKAYSKYPLTNELIHDVFDVEDYNRNKNLSQRQSENVANSLRKIRISKRKKSKTKGSKPQSSTSKEKENIQHIEHISEADELKVPEEGIKQILHCTSPLDTEIQNIIPNDSPLPEFLKKQDEIEIEIEEKKDLNKQLFLEKPLEDNIKEINDEFKPKEEILNNNELKLPIIVNEDLVSNDGFSKKAKFEMTINDKNEFVKSLDVSNKRVSINYIEYYFRIFMDKIRGSSKASDKIKLEKSKKKVKFLQKANEVINDHLDAHYIVKKMIEIDKMKTIIFNEEQLAVFDYISKPKVSFEEDQLDNIQLSCSMSMSPVMRSQKTKNITVIRKKELDIVVNFCNKMLRGIESSRELNYMDEKLFKLIDRKFFDHIKL